MTCITFDKGQLRGPIESRGAVDNALTLSFALPVTAHNGGLFVSRGVGIHPDRTIDSYELIVVRSGTLAIQEESTPFHVHAGEALLLFPHRRHYGTHPYDSGLSFYWIHFALGPGDKGLGAEGESEKGLTVAQQVCLPRSEDAMALCHRFLHSQETDRERTVPQRSLLLLLLLAEIAEAWNADNVSERSPALPTGNALAGRADALLRVRFAETDLSTHTLAGTLGCNPDYLGRIYRRGYGKPLTDALHEYRLRHARYLLLDDSRNVNEIARSCGFTDTGYFRRLFKRSVGVTPQGFRRLHARAYVNTA